MANETIPICEFMGSEIVFRISTSQFEATDASGETRRSETLERLKTMLKEATKEAPSVELMRMLNYSSGGYAASLVDAVSVDADPRSRGYTPPQHRDYQVRDRAKMVWSSKELYYYDEAKAIEWTTLIARQEEARKEFFESMERERLAFLGTCRPVEVLRLREELKKLRAEARKKAGEGEE